MSNNTSRLLFKLSYLVIILIPIILLFYYCFIFSDYDYIWFTSKILTVKYVIYNNTNHYIYDNLIWFNKTYYFNKYISFQKLKKYYNKNNLNINNSSNDGFNDNKFISHNNYIIDSEAFHKFFFVQKKTSIFQRFLSFIISYEYTEDNDDNDNDNDNDKLEYIISILFNFSLNSTRYWYREKKINYLIQYIDNKIKEEEHNENNNFKNLIEFEDKNNLIKFLKIDLNLYKYIFPYCYDLEYLIFSLIILLVLLFFDEKDFKCSFLFLLFFYMLIYINNNIYLKDLYNIINNINFLDIHNIKCNKYIQNLLYDYLAHLKNIKLIPFLYYSNE